MHLAHDLSGDLEGAFIVNSCKDLVERPRPFILGADLLCDDSPSALRNDRACNLDMCKSLLDVPGAFDHAVRIRPGQELKKFGP